MYHCFILHLDLQANLYHVHHVLVMQLHYFRYDQKLMRPHFLRCVEEGRMTPFPAKQIKPPRAINKTKVKLHCICRLLEDGEEEMAYCPSEQ